MSHQHDTPDSAGPWGRTCIRCGTMAVHRRLMDSSPRYTEARRRIEDQAFRAARGLVAPRTGVLRIPVVVHVVWNTPEQNISRAQIDSQIEVLNADFRARNTDLDAVPAPFAPLVADAGIVFALADRAPDGSATEGVLRVQSSVRGFQADDAVKFSDRGGSDGWPSDAYLNLWVCPLLGGLLGYAQFPGGPTSTDGVVVTVNTFGTTGTARAPFNRGRTTTHEIGHWLNLRHIWGDDDEGCSGSDFVDDTPNQAGANTGVPQFPSLSCNNAPFGDLFMNYMDYVDDAAMVMFTQGQVVRMQAALDGPRATIGMPADGPDAIAALPEPDSPAFEPPPVVSSPPGGQSFDWPAMTPPIPEPMPGMASGPAPAQSWLTGAYATLLQHYAHLYRLGLLDAQGLQAWRQSWAAYQRLLEPLA